MYSLFAVDCTGDNTQDNALHIAIPYIVLIHTYYMLLSTVWRRPGTDSILSLVLFKDHIFSYLSQGKEV